MQMRRTFEETELRRPLYAFQQISLKISELKRKESFLLDSYRKPISVKKLCTIKVFFKFKAILNGEEVLPSQRIKDQY